MPYEVMPHHHKLTMLCLIFSCDSKDGVHVDDVKTCDHLDRRCSHLGHFTDQVYYLNYTYNYGTTKTTVTSSKPVTQFTSNNLFKHKLD
jgi:hypothetical protein